MNKSIFGLMPKVSKEKSGDVNIDDQLNVVDKFRDIVEEGSIEDFIIIGLDKDNQMVMASFCDSNITGVGILEMGKYAMIEKSAGSCDE